MNSYWHIVVAAWLGIGTIVFGLVVYALRRGSDNDPTYTRNRAVQLVLNTVPGRIGFFLLCLGIWPVMILKFLAGFFGAMLRDLQWWFLKRRMASATVKLGGAIRKIVEDPEADPEIKEKLRIEMDLLRRVMNGEVTFTEDEIKERFEKDERSESQVQDEVR